MTLSPDAMKAVGSLLEKLSRKIYGLPTSFPRARLHGPIAEIGLNILTISEDFCGTALRSWALILNDEASLGTTARASLQGAAAKFWHWPLELAFHYRKNGFPLCPSIVASNMATLLTSDLHPSGGLEIWSRNQISTSLSSRISIKTEQDGCPLDTQQFPQPSLLLQKLAYFFLPLYAESRFFSN